MIRIDIGNLELSVPSEWNELTVGQLLFLHGLVTGNVSVQEVKIKMLLYCLDANVCSSRLSRGDWYAIEIKKNVFHLSKSEVVELTALFDFLFAVNEAGDTVFNIQLTKNPFPTVEINELKYSGPSDGLVDLSYGQFIMLQTVQSMMLSDFGYIDNFLAVIYKQGAFVACEDGEGAVFKSLDADVKGVIFWWYLGCMNFIADKFSNVFGGESSAGGSVFDSQMRIVDALADGDVTKREGVKRALLFDALYTLEIRAENERKQNDNK